MSKKLELNFKKTLHVIDDASLHQIKGGAGPGSKGRPGGGSGISIIYTNCEACPVPDPITDDEFTCGGSDCNDTWYCSDWC